MFDTVLVANRGEIAVRILRTLRKLGIRSVAVYSDADASARHVREADIAVRIGPAPAAQSYLAIDKLLSAAIGTNAQAIHPGYGFLSENAAFADACADSSITFIGPSADAITIMGDKLRAKQTVRAAGVPVVPGRTDLAMTDDELVAAADEVGYPVLVKPSAGGGGKGMRLVREPAQLRAAVVGARREAKLSFGDDTLFVERFVVRPRHVEIQVLADRQGTVLYLGERECSLQRRHQKIVEEAPSVLLDEGMRATMGRAAVDIARSVGYVGVGTVEFIVSSEAPEDFFFMEMHTRLQVEHPVTEMVTGLDLVEQQVRVAAGEALDFGQDDVALRGHAIEARIYAEDPAHDFVPSVGRILALHEPAGDGVRVDSALVVGADVGTTYDPMLGKVIAWGPDRSTALSRLDRALAHTVVLGLQTNITFLRALLRLPDVRDGQLDTELVEHAALPHLVDREPPDAAYAAFGLSRLFHSWPHGPIVDRWNVPDGWRFGGSAAPSAWTVSGPDGTPVVISITGTPAAAMVQIDDKPAVDAAIERLDGAWLVTVAGGARRAVTMIDGLTTWLWLDGATWALSELPPGRTGSGSHDSEGEVRSPMPGTILTINVAAGDNVEKGDTLLVVEAMKMEYSMSAPLSGRVDEVLVHVGDRVVVNALLTRITSSETSS